MPAKRFECFYGAPGSAKSTAVVHRIKSLVNAGFIRRARVVVGDGSAASYMSLVKAGVVELLDYTVFDYPISTCEQLAEGAWPLNINGPEFKADPSRTAEKVEIGLTCFEGISVMGTYIMGDKKGGFANRAAKGERIGGESEIRLIDGEVDQFGKWDKVSGSGRAYGGHTQGHYNQGQLRLMNVLERSKMINGEVIWTAHERVMTKGARLIGPEGIGEAQTPSFLRMFGNTLHFVKAVKPEKGKDPHTGKEINHLVTAYRIYTRDHHQPEGVVLNTYLATTRIDYPEMMPEYLESKVPGESIRKYYQIIEQSEEKAAAEVKPKEKEEAA